MFPDWFTLIWELCHATDKNSQFLKRNPSTKILKMSGYFANKVMLFKV